MGHGQKSLTEVQILKRMAFNGDKLPCYEDMESKFLIIVVSMNLGEPDHTGDGLKVQKSTTRHEIPLSTNYSQKAWRLDNLRLDCCNFCGESVK